jgi:hypothetical protein
MPFVKLGENIEISRIENTDSCIPAVNAEVLDNFKKFAANLKKIAPKAEDFLYFSAVMMHAAEASALNDDGTPKLNAKGEPVKVGWDKSGGTWRWTSNDPSIKPYRNSNGDIFPEEELVKAYRKWVHKPLCIDHKSSSVDHVRGFIVDTYYDRDLKRVIALCALDKHNYPDLARKVATGYSSCVSMGTAVGRAICSDCATVARTEQDFCDHMRRKSCYGEINVDLNPIELSIVVNGADPKANIKHIIAAANTMNSYLETRSAELNKIANNYTAVLTVNSTPGQTNNSAQFTVNSTDLDNFKNEIQAAFEKLEEIKSTNFSEDTNDLAFNQSSGTVAMNEASAPNMDSGLTPPHDRYASSNNEASISELREVTAAIEAKLSQMKQSLDKLLNTSKTTQEENNMSGSNDLNKKAYFQGTEEPTPGQKKYPVDPMNDKVRDTEDKQMVGESPFPDTGAVDGLHPGDLERKKMLARAAAEERAMKREAAVNAAKKALKTAYFQGGGGVNEPTPGKVKYPAEKLNDDLRDHEDKQMVGQKPFPGVGAADGMHPSPASADVADEKKRKELLQRASLRARFVKAANADGTQNLDNSAWEVFLGDNLVLTASVADLSGGRSELFYDNIATKDFGAKLIEKVKAQGADKVRALVKSAQIPPAAPAEAAPADAAPVGDAPAADAAPVGEDTGASGDPKQNAVELAERVRDLSSDLAEAVNALTGEQAEMGDMGAPLAAAASEGAALNTIRKELNVALTDAMKETIAQLQSSKEELEMIAGMYDNGVVASANEEFVGSIVDDAFNDAKTAVADGFKLLTAFVKYARGTKAIVKRAEIEAELNALAEGDSMSSEEKDSHSSDDDLMSLINDTNADLDDVKDMMADDNDHTGLDLEDLESLHADDVDVDDNDLKAKPEELKNLEVKPGTNVEVTASADFDTKEGRAALRAKLAADAVKFSPVLHDAHPKGGVTTELDVKPQGDLAKVEDLEETHDAMLDLANAPPKVRKEAAAIDKLISEGKLDPADLDALVAEGLDKDAVAYYKKFYGQVDGGSEFASELVKEHVKAELEQELADFKVKMARAYELAYDMVDRGLCSYDRNSISAQVDEIMTFNDASFDSLKRVVARHNVVLGLRKEASGRMPQVGIFGSSEVTSTESEGSLLDELSKALATSNKRSF